MRYFKSALVLLLSFSLVFTDIVAAAVNDKVFNFLTGRFDFVRSSGSLPSGSTHYIHNQGTLQVGATFYVSSGTVLGPFYVIELTLGSVLFAGEGGLLSQDNTNLFWDDTNNELGIGTTVPDGILHLDNGISNTDLIIEKDQGTSGRLVFHNEGSEEAVIDLDSVELFNIKALGNGEIAFNVKVGASDTEIMRVDRNFGAIGINETAPVTYLHVSGTHQSNIGLMQLDGSAVTHAYMSLSADTGRNSGILFLEEDSVKWWIDYNSGGNYWRLFDAAGGVATFVVTDTENDVGINEVAPGAKLHVQTSATTKIGQIIKGTASQSADLFQLQDSSGGVFFTSGDGLASSEVVWNDQQVDIDFRIEGETDANLFFADASTDRIGLGTATPAAVLELNVATATDPGLIIQSTDDSVTNDLFQAQDAAGTAFIAIGGDKPWVLEFKNTGSSIFIGDRAGESDDLSANANTFVGNQAGRENTIGGSNVGIGSSALLNNISGSNNLAMGSLAMLLNQTGTSNVAMGFGALDAITGGSNNTAIGSAALTKLLANVGSNTAIGGSALTTATSGINTAIGFQSLGFLVSGTQNTAVGYQAGIRALGSQGVYVGYQASDFATTSDGSIIIGYQCADNLTTGDHNLAIGTNINLPSATASNQMNIANFLYSEGIDGSGDTLSAGNLGVSITDPDSKIELDTLTTGTTGFHIKGVASQAAPLLIMTDESDATFFDSGDGIAGSEVVWNDQQVDIDFRIEGETVDDLLLTNAALDFVGIVESAPTSTLDVNGSLSMAIETVTGTSDTLDATNHVVLVDDDTAGSTVTITLPAASGVAGRIYHIKKLGTTANVIVDANSSELIDGATTATLTTQYESIMIVCNGTSWFII